MNNVFDYLWVKICTFVTYFLLRVLSSRSIKFIIIPVRSIFSIRRIGTYYLCIYVIWCIQELCMICVYSILCMYKIVRNLIVRQMTLYRKWGPNPPVYNFIHYEFGIIMRNKGLKTLWKDSFDKNKMQKGRKALRMIFILFVIQILP